MTAHDTHAVVHAEEHAHPTARKYVQIAVILTIITVIEVAILYLPDMTGIDSFRAVLVPIFLLLSAIKFLLVVGWYMHLRFDPPFFLRVFGFALVVALTIATAFIALFHGIYF